MRTYVRAKAGLQASTTEQDNTSCCLIFPHLAIFSKSLAHCRQLESPPNEWLQVSGKLKDARKTKLKINIECHSGIDSFPFSRDYNMKGQIINTIGTL